MFFAEKFSQIIARFLEKLTIKDPSTFEIEGIFCIGIEPNYSIEEISVVATDTYFNNLREKWVSKGYIH